MPHHTDPPPTDSPLTRRTLLQRAGGMAGLAGVTLLMACGSSKANSAGNAAPPLATVEPATTLATSRPTSRVSLRACA